jgi:hypothetical protein
MARAAVARIINYISALKLMIRTLLNNCIFKKKINIWNLVFRVIIACSLYVVIASIFNVEFYKIKLVSLRL